MTEFYESLIGKHVIGLDISEGDDALRFRCADESIIWSTEGDCCSNYISWCLSKYSTSCQRLYETKIHRVYEGTMIYYETLAAMLPWRPCPKNGCDSINYNGYHIHNHSLYLPLAYQLWDADHKSIKSIDSLASLLRDIDEGII